MDNSGTLSPVGYVFSALDSDRVIDFIHGCLKKGFFNALLNTLII